MGGAQAGEVASQIAVEAFKRGLQDSAEPETALAELARAANSRIHELSHSHTEQAGMGTTLTAMYVGPEDVSIAHVGDSRAYCMRDGELMRLTDDHSLVDELMRQGRLTREEAEEHPQRSVITRALGPEASVQVDIDIFPAKAGDLFLLCSDGLTSMVHEPELRPFFEAAESLEELGKRLIDAANAAGGRDNITVILFRLEEVGSPATAEAEEGETSEYDTFKGEAVRGPRQGVTRAESDTRVGEDALRSGDVADALEDDYRRSGTVAMSAVRPREQTAAPAESEPAAPPEEPPPKDDPAAPAAADAPPPRTAPLPGAAGAAEPRRRRRRFPVGLVVALVLLAIVLVGAWMATRAVYFVGTDTRDGRTITIFRGLPYDLPLGIHLYERYHGSGVTIDEVPRARRATFTNHKLRSRDDAQNLVIAAERGQIE